MSKVVPERRFVTVLFADIKGFTSLSENLDPEDVEDIINSIFAKFREIIEQHGGYLDKFIGDAVMAVFGAPHSHSDDPRRAILSGLLMQRALNEFNKKHDLNLGLRIGINTGDVLWSSIAGEKPTVMGDAVNVAQRLESIGEPGKVFVSEKTMELASEYFEFEYKGETQVKGRKEPVRVYLVLREKEQVFTPRGEILTPLFERERELATLLNVFEETLKDRIFKIAQVYGDAGIGKTRLSMEFLKNIENRSDVDTILVRADPLKQGSYQIISRIILEKIGKSTYDELKDELFNLFSLKESLSEAEIKTFTSLILSIIFPSRSDGTSSKNVLKERVNALYALFEIMFSRSDGATVIVIDDFHHVDEESYNLIVGLREFLTRVPLLIIVNSRKLFKSLNADVEIPLSPVSKTSLYSFLRFIFQAKDEKISPEFVDFINEKTGGNPYYVEELLRYIKEKGLYEHNPLRVKDKDLHLPETLKGILTEKVDSLPQDEKETVKVASCIGRIFWQGVLEIVQGKPVGNSLNTLQLEGIIQKETKSLIENDIEYSFIHELLRDAAYELLTKKERVKLHNIIGGVLELYEDNATLLYDAARHFMLAQNPEKAKRLFEKAGDIAKSQANYRFALQCYEKVQEPSALLLLKKAHVLEILSDYENATQAVLDALSLIDEEDEETYTKLKIRLASIKEKEGDFSTALRILEEIEDQRNPVLRAEVFGRIAWVMFRLSRFEEAESKARMALLIINRLSQSNKEVLIRKGVCLNTLANIHTRRGDWKTAYEYFKEAMSIYRSLGDKDRLSRILINMSTYLMYVKDYERALSYLNEALNLTTETANRGLLPAIYNNIGLIYMENGEIEKAIANFQHALKISSNLGNRFMEMNVLVNMARAYSTINLHDDAILYFQKALEIARSSGNKSVEGIALANISFTYYIKGELEEAEKNAREAIFIFRELGDIYSELDVLPTLLYTLFENNKIDEALALIDEYLDILKEKEVEGATFRLLLLKALGIFLVGDKENARELLSIIEFKSLDKNGRILYTVLSGLLSLLEEKEFKVLTEGMEKDEQIKLLAILNSIKEGENPLPYLSDAKLIKRLIAKIVSF